MSEPKKTILSTYIDSKNFKYNPSTDDKKKIFSGLKNHIDKALKNPKLSEEGKATAKELRDEVKTYIDKYLVSKSSEDLLSIRADLLKNKQTKDALSFFKQINFEEEKAMLKGDKKPEEEKEGEKPKEEEKEGEKPKEEEEGTGARKKSVLRGAGAGAGLPTAPGKKPKFRSPFYLEVLGEEAYPSNKELIEEYKAGILKNKKLKNNVELREKLINDVNKYEEFIKEREPFLNEKQALGLRRSVISDVYDKSQRVKQGSGYKFLMNDEFITELPMFDKTPEGKQLDTPPETPKSPRKTPPQPPDEPPPPLPRPPDSGGAGAGGGGDPDGGDDDDDGDKPSRGGGDPEKAPPSISMSKPTKGRKQPKTPGLTGKAPSDRNLLIGEGFVENERAVPPSKQLGKELVDLSVDEIDKDLDYFYDNFSSRLKNIKRTKSKNLKFLRRFYKRVVAALRIAEPEKRGKEQALVKGGDVGVVIRGADYIKNILKEIILENSIDGLSTKDMLINLEAKKEKGKADAGSYEFKTNKTSGLTFAEGEPIARLIPKTQEKQVKEEDPARRTEKIARLKPLPAGYRRQQITAAKMVRANPFLNANQSKIRLRTLY